MSVSIIVAAIRQEREDVAVRWLAQVTVNRAAAGRMAVAVDGVLLLVLFDEVAEMLDACAIDAIPRRHHANAFTRLAEFPESVAVVIDVFQAGSQVLGAFAVENAGPVAAWSNRLRNRFLGELDAVFHVLVHREIQALCEHCLGRANPAPVGCPSPPAHGLIDLPALSRAAAMRN